MASKLAKQTILIYILTYFTAIGAYFTRVILTKQFDPVEFGLFYAVLGLFAIISIFNDLGLTETLNYYGVKWWEEKKYGKLKFLILTTLVVQIGTATLITLLFWLNRAWILTSFFKVGLEYELFFTIMLSYFLFYNVFLTITSLANIIGEFHYARIKDGLFRLILLLLFVFVLMPNPSLQTLGLIWSGTFICFSVLFALFVAPKFRMVFKQKTHFETKLLKSTFKYSSQVMIGTSAAILMSKIDVVFLTTFLNVESVGYYEVALALASITAMVVSPLTGIFFPLTTKYLEHNKKKELNNILQLTYGFYISFSLFFLLAFFVYSKEIITLMFSPTYLVVQSTFLVLSLAIVFQLLNAVHYVVLGGMGKVKERNLILFVGAAINIVFNFFLVQYFGLIGIAISTLFVFITMFTLSYRLIKSFGIKVIESKQVFFQKAKWFILSALLFVISAALFKSALTPLHFFENIFISTLLKSAISAIISSLLFFGTLWAGNVYRIKQIASHFGENVSRYVPEWL